MRGLDQFIEPYQFAEDFGPPLSEWEKSDACVTDKFREEFPDGNVPIRHVPMLGVDAHEWPEKMLSRFEAARKVCNNVDRCAELREQYLLFEEAASVRGMMCLGLTLRQIAAYVERDLEEVVRVCRGGHQVTTGEDLERYADLDEEIALTGSTDHLALAEKYGVGWRAVRTLINYRVSGTLGA